MNVQMAIHAIDARSCMSAH